MDPDKLQNILLSQQLCTFRLLFAWRDNIAREEDESYGWENFLCCIFNTFMFLISRKLCIGAVVEYLISCLFVCFICYMYLVSWLVWLKRKILLSFFSALFFPITWCFRLQRLCQGKSDERAINFNFMYKLVLEFLDSL